MSGRPPQSALEEVMRTPIDGLPSTPITTTSRAALDVRRDGTRDDLRLPPAVAAEGERVGLVLDEPEAVQAEEPVLRAGHLLDAPAALAQQVDERRVDAGAARAAVGLGVLVEQAVGDEGDAGGLDSVTRGSM